MEKKDFDTKLERLREKYLGHSESQLDIDQYEKDITTLFEEAEMADHPVFKKIAEDAERKMNEINALLMNDNNLDEAGRKALIRERGVWRFVFERFGLIPHDNALKAVEQLLDSKLAQ